MKNIAPDQVLVTSACFRQRVNLPSAQVNALSPDELAAAIGFEVSPFSGIPFAESEMAWKRTSSPDSPRAVFDVVQIRKTDLAAELARARKGGKKALAVTAEPDQSIGESVADLPWVELRGRGGKLPGPMCLWLCVCALAALWLGWDAYSLRGEGRALEREVVAQRALQAQRDAIQRRVDGAHRELGTLRQQRMDEARAQQNVEVLRSAWALLLDAVPGACADESVMRRIEATGAYSAKLVGASLSAESAAKTLVRLTDALSPPRSGWVVRPGAIGANAAGGMVNFECVVEFDPEGQFR